MESKIEAILERNARVEADKAWEVSMVRRLSITVLTYVIASFFLWSIGSTNFYLQSLIPAGGYFLSTLSLPILKKWWVESMYSKR